jgi:hypothetical protein
MNEILSALQIKVAILETKIDIIIKLIFAALAIILSDFLWRILKMIGPAGGNGTRRKKIRKKI